MYHMRKLEGQISNIMFHAYAACLKFEPFEAIKFEHLIWPYQHIKTKLKMEFKICNPAEI